MDLWLAGVLIAGWLLVVAFFRLNRIWLPYYIIGSVGLAFVIIFVGRATGLEHALQVAVAAGVHAVSLALGLPTEIFQSSPGAILVLVVSQDIGWTMLQVTVESSGLLETGVIAGMLLFYPGWGGKKRIWFTIAAITLTYLANVVRLMVIVATLHYMGKSSLLISHTIIGRAVFFALVVAIYWFLMTRPTLRTVRHKIDDELMAS
ncbi:MAG: archaeosortase/exosortase family protein [Chloroflexi bacterium]|nr:archaeosortase/exosortase family protein [Chloroflexota bacterium]